MRAEIDNFFARVRNPIDIVRVGFLGRRASGQQQGQRDQVCEVSVLHER